MAHIRLLRILYLEKKNKIVKTLNKLYCCRIITSGKRSFQRVQQTTE